uniref:RNA polymerase alpha subunit n=1 Tax=Passiflora vespertilio TaxID=237893 RepID=A0A7H0TYW4_PASVE|nr:RNA polymerase alpha subunit [Passiflora vespertilio]YP_010007373.1 RNA polymerase alpha subunit [Passiflora vespertilio]QNR06185.1 RNA polymerase alpha subunit [Passiflora vespertilio]QNR06216.1 RNA polymerase alpha subunit [Passiflora vespertilio]
MENFTNGNNWSRENRWVCIESQVQGPRNYYGRFVLPGLKRGEGNTLGFMIRQILLAQIKGPTIAHVKFAEINGLFPKDLHEFSTIPGVQESIHQILMNLKQIVFKEKIVFKAETKGTYLAHIFRPNGYGKVTAKDILQHTPFITIVDPDQYILNLTQPCSLFIQLEIGTKGGYYTVNSWPIIKAEQEGFRITIGGLPVEKVHFSVMEKGDEEFLFVEIWTNGSLTPKEAFLEASKHCSRLLFPFMLELKGREMELIESHETLDEFEKQSIHKTFNIEKYIGVDQLGLSSRIYTYLIRAHIYTAWDLSKISLSDLSKIDGFLLEDAFEITKAQQSLTNKLVIAENFKRTLEEMNFKDFKDEDDSGVE